MLCWLSKTLFTYFMLSILTHFWNMLGDTWFSSKPLGLFIPATKCHFLKYLFPKTSLHPHCSQKKSQKKKWSSSLTTEFKAWQFLFSQLSEVISDCQTTKIFFIESHLPKGWYSAVRSLDFHQDFTYFYPPYQKPLCKAYNAVITCLFANINAKLCLTSESGEHG